MPSKGIWLKTPANEIRRVVHSTAGYLVFYGVKGAYNIIGERSDYFKDWQPVTPPPNAAAYFPSSNQGAPT